VTGRRPPSAPQQRIRTPSGAPLFATGAIISPTTICVKSLKLSADRCATHPFRLAENGSVAVREAASRGGLDLLGGPNPLRLSCARPIRFLAGRELHDEVVLGNPERRIPGVVKDYERSRGRPEKEVRA
jgi:hypothetical protein